MMGRYRQFLLAAFALLMIMTVRAPDAIAQTDPRAQGPSVTNTCPTIVEDALEALGNNCAGLGRNEACYGYRRVDTTFDFEVAPDYFAAPSDRAELANLRNIRTAGLNVESGQWGIAVLNIQANIPNTLAGQAVTFLLMGDAEMENMVRPPVELESPVIAVVTIRARIRSGPSVNQTVLGFADAIDELEATGISQDGAWLRINYQGSSAWVSLDVVSIVPGGMEALPVVDAQPPSPMQAFFFSTSTDEPQCNEAPDVVAVKSRATITVDLNVNGADISIGSFITFKQISQTEFSITVHEGHVETPDGVIATAGLTLVGSVDPETGAFVEWVEVRVATPEELAEGETSGVIMEELDLEELTAPPVPTTVPGGNADIPDNPPPQSGGANCNTLQATSPLNGLAYGSNIFYWDAAGGAVTDYRLRVNNAASGQTLSATVPAPSTNATVDLTDNTIGEGYDFSWQVEALNNGVVVCRSEVVRIQREATRVPDPNFNVTVGCTNEYEFTVSFNGFMDRETITASLTDEYGYPQTQTGTGPSGQLTFYAGSANGVTVSAPASNYSASFGNFNCGAGNDDTND